MAVLPFLVNWHFPKFSIAAGSLNISFPKGLFPEPLQMFVASHLGVSLFTFYEKCWCLDLSLCLDFCIIPDLFFQKHHLGEQTWLRIIVYLLFLYYLIVQMFLLSSVKLVKLLSSNLDLMNYLLVLLLFSTFLSTFLIISKLLPKYGCFLFYNFRSSKMSSFSQLFWHCVFLKCIIKMLSYGFLSLSSIVIVMKQVIWCVVTCLFNTSDNVAL